MAVSYNKLFKLLIDKKMKKKELCELAGVSASTIGKMGRGEPVSVEMVERICLALECTPMMFWSFTEMIKSSKPKEKT